MTIKKSRDRCANCPASQGEVCGQSLDRVRAMQLEASKKGDVLSITTGCSWYVNSAEYGYSFHNMLSDLHGSPVPDKEIMQLLLISAPQLEEIYKSAIKKLANLEDKTVLYNMLDLIDELPVDQESSSIYLPDSFKETLNDAIAKDIPEEEERIPGKRGPKPGSKRPKKEKLDDFIQPAHHSGERRDIFFATRKSSIKVIADSKKALDAKKKKQKEGKDG